MNSKKKKTASKKPVSTGASPARGNRKSNGKPSGAEADKSTVVRKSPTPDREDSSADRKPVPILDRLDAVVIDKQPPEMTTKPPEMTTKLPEMTTKPPEMTTKPLLVMTEPSMDRGDDDEVYQCVEGGDGMQVRPTKIEPRVRRVSDVIDSMGDRKSLPSSPRLATFSDGFNSTSLPSTPRLPMSFAPDWLADRTKANDLVGAAKRANDATDAAPIGSSSFAAADLDDLMPRVVLANLSVEKHSLEYTMTHPRRGRAIIFNHDKFETGGFTSRPGSDVDAKNLEVTLSQLHFEVSVFHNLAFAEIKTVISDLKAEDHSNADCLLITILTHGMSGGYVLAKDTPYSVDYLWTSFKADVCTSLAGKPKIFFIQACRGETLDSGVHMMRAASRTQTDSAASDYKLPSFADFLVAHGTVDGHYAFRNPETGTWFIECLCTELRENGTTVDLLKLLTYTSRRVAVDYQSYNDLVPWQNDMKQVPSVTSMLIRDIYFRPKEKAQQQ